MSHKWQNNGEEWLAWSFCMGYVLLCMGKHRNYHNALFMVIHCFIFPSLIFLVSYSRWSEKKILGSGKETQHLLHEECSFIFAVCLFHVWDIAFTCLCYLRLEVSVPSSALSSAEDHGIRFGDGWCHGGRVWGREN